MKAISVMLMTAMMFISVALQAQDAATQERLDKLSGQIEDVIATQRAQQKQLEALAKEIDSLREQAARHTGNYASQEDYKHLADAVKDVDRKRIEDAERISKQLDKLGRTLAAPLATSHKPPQTSAKDADEKPATEKGYRYTVQSGDTLSVIVATYREKNVKVTVDQILKANPGLKPEKMPVGKDIWIPMPR